jgi:hypothetical protein
VKSTAALLVIGLLVASALVFQATGWGPITGQHTVVTLHCGLKQAAVEFEGRIWEFVTDDPSANPPWFTTSNSAVYTIVRNFDQVLAYGPLFTVHRLVPAEEGPNMVGGCL